MARTYLFPPIYHSEGFFSLTDCEKKKKKGRGIETLDEKVRIRVADILLHWVFEPHMSVGADIHCLAMRFDYWLY